MALDTKKERFSMMSLGRSPWTAPVIVPDGSIDSADRLTQVWLYYGIPSFSVSQSIYKSLYVYLSGQSAISNLVGSRIYPHYAPESAVMPYVVFQRISNIDFHHFGAQSKVARDLFQFDIWDTDSTSIEAVKEAVREEIDGFQGTLSGIDVRLIEIIDNDESDEYAKDGSDTRYLRSRIDANVFYFRSVPTF